MLPFDISLVVSLNSIKDIRLVSFEISMHEYSVSFKFAIFSGESVLIEISMEGNKFDFWEVLEQC